MENYLNSIAEDTPHWLKTFKQGDRFDVRAFLQSRIVFYPGSGDDAGPIRLFSSARAAHCFVYVDYLQSKNETINRLLPPPSPTKDHLASSSPLEGYRSIARISLDRVKAFRDWQPHVKQLERSDWPHQRAPNYWFVEILERDPESSHAERADRIAILFSGSDGIAAYDQLFCQAGQNAPFTVVLQDHGLGGNYTTFGNEGLLAELVRGTNAFPEYLLIGEWTTPWREYEALPLDGAPPSGMHGNVRRLFAKNCTERKSRQDAS